MELHHLTTWQRTVLRYSFLMILLCCKTQWLYSKSSCSRFIMWWKPPLSQDILQSSFLRFELTVHADIQHPSHLFLCSDELSCRICHEGMVSGELLSPCQCSGSLAMVHRACLEYWLTSSNSGHCELCHHQFALERLPKPLTEVGIRTWPLATE